MVLSPGPCAHFLKLGLSSVFPLLVSFLIFRQQKNKQEQTKDIERVRDLVHFVIGFLHVCMILYTVDCILNAFENQRESLRSPYRNSCRAPIGDVCSILKEESVAEAPDVNGQQQEFVV